MKNGSNLDFWESGHVTGKVTGTGCLGRGPRRNPARTGRDSALAKPRETQCPSREKPRQGSQACCRVPGRRPWQTLAGLGVTRLWPSHGHPVPVSATAETRAQFRAAGCLAEGQADPGRAGRDTALAESRMPSTRSRPLPRQGRDSGLQGAWPRTKADPGRAGRDTALAESRMPSTCLGHSRDRGMP